MVVLPRHAMLAALVCATACGSFGESGSSSSSPSDASSPSSPEAGPGPTAEGGPTSDGGACTRPRFTNGFERTSIDPPWNGPFTKPAGSGIRIDTTHAATGTSSLLAALAQSADERYAYVALDLASSACPLTVSLSVQIDRPPQGSEYVTYLRVGLEGGETGVTLRMTPNGHRVIEDRTGSPANVATLPALMASSFTRVKLVYDPSVSPARMTVTVADAQPILLTHQISSAPPRAVRLGASYASPGDATSTWIDDVVVE